MRQMIEMYVKGKGAERDEALKSIVAEVAENPARFRCFKEEFISLGLVEGDIAGMAYVLERLDFVPEPSPKSEVGEYVYRGAGVSPSVLKAQGGFKACGTSRSIRAHQKETGCSIYVGASKDLGIAVEHAAQRQGKWVYKIATDNGICVNSFLYPFKGMHMEQEVVFAYCIPIAQVHGYAAVTGFYDRPVLFQPV